MLLHLKISKKAMISGLVHRIYRACSSWHYITESLSKAKLMLKNNQYPEEYMEEIISKTITKIISKQGKKDEDTENEKEKPVIFSTNYRGKSTEDYVKQLNQLCGSKDSPAYKIPIKVVYTTRKLKSILPSLKPSVVKALKSDVVYKIDCRVCKDSYVGQTERHMTTRLGEHINNRGPVKAHITNCSTTLSEDDVTIIMECQSSLNLMTYEALYIKQMKPQINTREEYRSKKLNIKWIVDSLYGGK